MAPGPGVNVSSLGLVSGLTKKLFKAPLPHENKTKLSVLHEAVHIWWTHFCDLPSACALKLYPQYEGPFRMARKTSEGVRGVGRSE